MATTGNSPDRDDPGNRSGGATESGGSGAGSSYRSSSSL
jgi:hypothetical protein